MKKLFGLLTVFLITVVSQNLYAECYKISEIIEKGDLVKDPNEELVKDSPERFCLDYKNNVEVNGTNYELYSLTKHVIQGDRSEKTEDKGLFFKTGYGATQDFYTKYNEQTIKLTISTFSSELKIASHKIEFTYDEEPLIRFYALSEKVEKEATVVEEAKKEAAKKEAEKNKFRESLRN